MIADLPMSVAHSVVEQHVTSVDRCWRLSRTSVACAVTEEYPARATDSGSTCTYRFRYIAKARRRADGRVVVTELTHPPDATCTFG